MLQARFVFFPSHFWDYISLRLKRTELALKIIKLNNKIKRGKGRSLLSASQKWTFSDQIYFGRFRVRGDFLLLLSWFMSSVVKQTRFPVSLPLLSNCGKIIWKVLSSLLTQVRALNLAELFSWLSFLLDTILQQTLDVLVDKVHRTIYRCKLF